MVIATESKRVNQSASVRASTVSPSRCRRAAIARVSALIWSAWPSVSVSDRSSRCPCSAATCALCQPSSSGPPRTRAGPAAPRPHRLEHRRPQAGAVLVGSARIDGGDVHGHRGSEDSLSVGVDSLLVVRGDGEWCRGHRR